ncbi:MAG TPA: hypothetical protein VNQ76_07240 [Planctomicrobium sp.]|nr:hypothetical protein [Planctomicrobium sp.]
MIDPEYSLLQRLTETPDLFTQIPVGGGIDLRLQTRLREQFPPELVRAALTQAELRHRARDRFSLAMEMWFDRFELEQATPELAARHKAERFSTTGQTVLDLFCGFGSNAIGLAQAGLTVTAVETTPEAGLRIELNAGIYGVRDRVDVRISDDPLSLAADGLIHIQPRRSAAKQRSVKLEEHVPSLEQLQALIQSGASGAITLSSASNFGGKFNDCELELISVNGDCREAVVWFGELRKEHAMQATLLPSGWTLSGNPWEAFGQVGPLGAYLYDPDPAIVRAGLVDVLSEHLQINRLDAAEEYFTSDERLFSPAVTTYEVLADLPNNDRDIRNYVREHVTGDVEIRCRHVPVDASAIRRKLPVTGKSRSGETKTTLFFARLDGKTRAIIARKLTNDSDTDS